MSSGRSFVDTNVLVYAVDTSEPEKRERARELLLREHDSLVISAQVLGEFYVTVTRKLPVAMPAAEAAAAVQRLSGLPIVAVDAELVRSAIAIRDEAALSYRDGLIVAAAQSAGCERLLTEDLSDGRLIDGLRIENPF